MIRSCILAGVGTAVLTPFSLQPSLVPQQSGTTQRLQAISAVTPEIVWASGVGGTFVRTTDGGKTWHAGIVPGADSLEFRDVQAVSDRIAYLLAAGEGSASRIYKTQDGGRTWSLQFRNSDPKAFFDCFDFWTPRQGLAFSDAVGGRFPLRLTGDGATWKDVGHRLPPAQENEGGFAASGTCVVTRGLEQAWIATGNGAKPRVLATSDRGATWKSYDTPLLGGQGAGGFTLGFRDSVHGMVAGGSLDSTRAGAAERVAVTADGGQHWSLASAPPFVSAVFGLSYVPGLPQAVLITGPGGAAWSPDEGRTWHRLADVSGYWAVTVADPKAGWLVGTNGRILKVSF
jgi:photosystem II stability/assembly factor-like uncharacterized protein